MKKIIPLSMVACLLLGFAACKKDYSCVCRDLSTNEVILTTTVSASSTEDAQEECDDQESAFYIGDRCTIQ